MDHPFLSQEGTEACQDFSSIRCSGFQTWRGYRHQVWSRLSMVIGPVPLLYLSCIDLNPASWGCLEHSRIRVIRGIWKQDWRTVLIAHDPSWFLMSLRPPRSGGVKMSGPVRFCIGLLIFALDPVNVNAFRL